MLWTLWLITFGPVTGQGGASVAVTPLAVYQAEAECKSSITHTLGGMEATYGKGTTPGLLFCVGGTPIKR